MRSIILLCAILTSLSSSGQLAQLQEVQSNRVMAKYYKQQMIWDSACSAYGKFVENKKYANPYDFLDFSYCCLKKNDTVLFTKYLSKAIEEGVDTDDISRFYIKGVAHEKDYLNSFLRENFQLLHRVFVTSHDTAFIAELNAIYDRDQAGRRPIEKLVAKDPKNWNKSPAFDSLRNIQNPADSINYFLAMQLFESGKFPGYHNCGAAATSFHFCMYHFDKAYVNWDKVFRMLKQAALAGDIDPTQVASIVDRHYLRLDSNLCYFYGSLDWGDHPFFDCKNVDKLRAEIGLEPLKTQYERQKRPLPACYGL
jgi:hypothetical protein